jgi:hypothetical protein
MDKLSQEEQQQIQNKMPSQEEFLAFLQNVKKFVDENKVKILIGTPCFGGMLHLGYFQSMMDLTINFTKLGIQFEIMTVGNESLITRARNGIVAKFLGEESFTHLLFIDADITFAWAGILKLVIADKDLSGGCYPKKTFNWEKIKAKVKQNPDIETKELIARGVDYVFNPVYFQSEDGKIMAEVQNGMVRVKDLGTGFMLIKKNVFETLRFKYPELKYRNNVAGYHNDKYIDCFYNFFDIRIDPETQVLLSEDYLFCKTWRECSGELWLDLGINLNHTGIIDYIGCLAINIGEIDILNQDTQMAIKQSNLQNITTTPSITN